MDIRTQRGIRVLVLMLLVLGNAMFAGAHAGAEELKNHYAELMPALENTPYGHPVQIDSSMDEAGLEGQVHVVLNAKYQKLSSLLTEHRAWCDIILLDQVIKGCIYRDGKVPEVTVYIGNSAHTSLDDAYRIDYRFEVVKQTDEYASIRLSAADGPLGTRDYELIIELVSVDSRTFARMQVSLKTGWRCRLALKAYLATLGRSKVGFTQVAAGRAGEQELVRGVRGLVERSVMRQLLGLQAYLGTRSLPASRRFEARLTAYHAGIQTHARQLQEMDRSTYMDDKRRVYREQTRLQAAVAGTNLVVAHNGLARSR